jgi:hypothetical protein
MSSLTGSKTAFTLSLLVMGFAVASSAMVVPPAFAQNATNPGGNQTMPGGNQTMPGGNTTKPVAFLNSNGITTVQGGGNQTVAPGLGAMIMPGQIKGSVDVKQAIKTFLSENMNVTLNDAIATAATHVNGTAVAGHLDVVQGFLVYRVIAVDITKEIVYSVIVDAGNGSVLATQSVTLAQLMAMHGGMMGMHGGMMGGQMMQPPQMMQPQGNTTSQGPMMGMGFQA